MSADRQEQDITRLVYEREALRYDNDRSRDLVERQWLEQFGTELPDAGAVMDLGCGAGEPIAGWLIENGYRVTGVDFALPLLELARERWPNGDWRVGDMRELDLPERFDGIICWDSFFHLTPDEQVSCMPTIARHLRPGGALLLTVGPRAAETTGAVGKGDVYHASLSPETYEKLFEESGLEVRAFCSEDPNCSNHSFLLGVKTS